MPLGIKPANMLNAALVEKLLSRLSEGEVRPMQFQFVPERLLCCIDQWWLSGRWTLMSVFHVRAWSDTVRSLEMLRDVES